MKRTDEDIEPASRAPGVELFPIRTVSSLTGVNAVTLRAWERRYGLVQPVRSASGHRLYRHEDIDLIHRVVALLDKGISISQARQALRGHADIPAGGSRPEDPTWAGWRQRMLSAIVRFDEDAADDAYNEALAAASIGQVTERLLAPLLEELGEHKDTAESGVAEARFFSVYMRNKLGARFHHRARGHGGPRFLGACLSGETSDIGLLLFALEAHAAGLCPVLLGADLPARELIAAVRRARCGALVLSGSNDGEPTALFEELSAMTAAVRVPVLVTGMTSVRRRDRVVAAGATPLGADIARGVKRLADALLPPARPPHGRSDDETHSARRSYA